MLLLAGCCRMSLCSVSDKGFLVLSTQRRKPSVRYWTVSAFSLHMQERNLHINLYTYLPHTAKHNKGVNYFNPPPASNVTFVTKDTRKTSGELWTCLGNKINRQSINLQSTHKHTHTLVKGVNGCLHRWTHALWVCQSLLEKIEICLKGMIIVNFWAWKNIMEIKYGYMASF